MIIWSIHTLDFFKKLEKNKVLYPNKKLLTWRNDFMDSYLWLADQMDKKIGGRPHPTAVPFWAWYQFKDSKHKKPDLRVRCHIDAGQQGVRMELNIPDNEVVLTDFDIWCDVLNKQYIPESYDDYEEFYRIPDKKKQFGFESWSKARQKRAERSWQKVFDLDFFIENNFYRPRAEKAIQATFWKLSVDQIQNITHFTARKPAEL